MIENFIFFQFEQIVEAMHNLANTREMRSMDGINVRYLFEMSPEQMEAIKKIMCWVQF